MALISRAPTLVASFLHRLRRHPVSSSLTPPAEKKIYTHRSREAAAAAWTRARAAPRGRGRIGGGRVWRWGDGEARRESRMRSRRGRATTLRGSRDFRAAPGNDNGGGGMAMEDGRKRPRTNIGTECLRHERRQRTASYKRSAGCTPSTSGNAIRGICFSTALPGISYSPRPCLLQYHWNTYSSGLPTLLYFGSSSCFFPVCVCLRFSARAMLRQVLRSEVLHPLSYCMRGAPRATSARGADAAWLHGAGTG